MTDQAFNLWLNSSESIRCLLVEVGVYSSGAESTRYISSANYISAATDTPPNTAYLPLIKGSLSVSEDLSIDGSASMSYGDVEINNIDGSLDSWLEDVWTNRPITVFVGDVRWAKSEFRQVFSGTVASISSREAGTLNLQLRDKLQRLNTPMSEQTLGGTTDNKDQVIPLCFGEVHNVEPLLTDPATLTYQVHNGPIERVIEVRDNGVPVSFTASLTTGKFSLAAKPAGTITVSIQGDKPGTYANDVGTLVKRIVTGFGKASDRFTDADVDLDNFAAFISAHPQPVGLYLRDKVNVLDACAQLASSLGAQLVMSRDGKLRLLKLSLPAPGVPTSVSAQDMAMGSIKVVSRPDVKATVKLGFCRNYTVQDNLQTGIPEVHKDLFKREWLTVAATNSAVAVNYRLSAEVDQADTLMLVATDAQAEANRRLALWSVQRNVIGYTGASHMLLTELGSAQTITHPRFNLGSGKTGQVVSLNRDWVTGSVDLGVLI